MRLNRKTYWALIVVVPSFIGLIGGIIARTASQQAGMVFLLPAMMVYIGIFIPLICYFRMRYLHFTTREMLITMLPFVGSKLRYRMYLDPH